MSLLTPTEMDLFVWKKLTTSQISVFVRVYNAILLSAINNERFVEEFPSKGMCYRTTDNLTHKAEMEKENKSMGY